jgi:hypothetical protein
LNNARFRLSAVGHNGFRWRAPFAVISTRLPGYFATLLRAHSAAALGIPFAWVTAKEQGAAMQVMSRCQKRRPPTHSRPSLLDPFLCGDAWMVSSSAPGLLVLDVENYPVAVQPGTGLEQASLNSLIFQLRQKAR